MSKGKKDDDLGEWKKQDYSKCGPGGSKAEKPGVHTRGLPDGLAGPKYPLSSLVLSPMSSHKQLHMLDKVRVWTTCSSVDY